MARKRLADRYRDAAPSQADVIVALGGDGFMLQTLHRFINDKIPIYGMNRGSVGFLMNDYSEDGLKERLAAANITRINPLAMVATDAAGKAHKSLAINEVSLFRQRHQAAKLRISIDGKVRMEELICDGVLVATPAGSTAARLSRQGPRVPITAGRLALTPMIPCGPRRWRGAGRWNGNGPRVHGDGSAGPSGDCSPGSPRDWRRWRPRTGGPRPWSSWRASSTIRTGWRGPWAAPTPVWHCRVSKSCFFYTSPSPRDS